MAKSFRRRFLVYPELQFVVIGFTVLTAFLSFVISMIVFRLFTHELINEVTSMGGSGEVIRNFLESHGAMFYLFFFVIVLFQSILVFVGGLWFTNKIVGPIYRLQSHMEKITRGETRSSIQFRDGDFFCDLAETYTKLLDFLFRN